MATSSVSQKQLAIGQWTATAYHKLGFTYRDPVLNKLYMYVQWDNGAGNLVNAFQGSPVGFYHFGMSGENSYIVTTDVSDSTRWIGTIVSNSSSTVTNGYYGFIQVVEPGAIIPCRLVTAAAASDLVAWTADDHLTTTTFASIGQQYVTRSGWVMSGVGATTVGTTNYYGNVLIV